MYLNTVVGDMVGFVDASDLLERGVRPRDLLDNPREAKVSLSLS